ncbi:hypothetical protein JOC78_002682 [Bacillus ectoiniformans]|uniref:hypothetical protein n=1 Tax=Bacillus ectoiniformans TaxID=1494429 RepID=UPI001EF7DCD1|nr:hypothetical protein [Bacillus ectoiniformans]MBM7649708.1 hypothetical protein [Bacillus ectoiniformans]
MITPTKFEKASEDHLAKVYGELKLPIIFFDSKKRHLPFVREDFTYETANWESLDNGSHTTIYLAGLNKDSEDAWYFYLSDQKNINKLYNDIFKKIGEL